MAEQLEEHALTDARNNALEEAAREAERRVIEYSDIDVLDTREERVRIAARIRRLKKEYQHG